MDKTREYQRTTSPERASDGSRDAGPKQAATVVALPLTQQVASRIRDMIVQDELVPGQRVRERALAEQLNVSRTPLREAIKILAAEGLVEILPNKGARVADPSPPEVRDMLRVLGALEALGGELACAEASDDEIEEIKALHFEMQAAFTRKDRLEYFKTNQKIHRAIVASSHNQSLIETHDRLNARLYRVRFQSNLRNRTWPTAMDEHNSILDALIRRDGERLPAVMRAHLGSTWEKVSELMKQALSTSGGATGPGAEHSRAKESRKGQGR
ncbi:MAG: GntR family transcriptional regulator [Rhodospirillales bacterium]|nr:GntR family transcriptional regulator [Paracoccaceae bacterium]MDH3910799.1 GntR family transcriptional regulator [Rhodospirillales bacterium]